MKVKILYVNDDWVELYRDGQLLADGHALSYRTLIKAANPEAELEEEHEFRCAYCEKVIAEPPPGERGYDCGCFVKARAEWQETPLDQLVSDEARRFREAKVIDG